MKINYLNNVCTFTDSSTDIEEQVKKMGRLKVAPLKYDPEPLMIKSTKGSSGEKATKRKSESKNDDLKKKVFFNLIMKKNVNADN